MTGPTTNVRLEQWRLSGPRGSPDRGAPSREEIWAHRGGERMGPRAPARLPATVTAAAAACMLASSWGFLGYALPVELFLFAYYGALAVPVVLADADRRQLNEWLELDSPRGRAIATIKLAVFLDMIGVGIFVPMLSYYWKEVGIPTEQLGLVSSAYNMSQIVSGIVLGYVSDHLLGRKNVLLLSFAGSAVSYALAGMVPCACVMCVRERERERERETETERQRESLYTYTYTYTYTYPYPYMYIHLLYAHAITNAGVPELPKPNPNLNPKPDPNLNPKHQCRRTRAT